ncbi:MAG: hypothetical protein PHS57_05725, partial [Alphaproteobacteria bacterium]|nr:hypothetical protein [Alphaproteobacteria bacterium]
MIAFLSNPVNTYAVAFALFVALSYFFIRKPLLRWIDSEIAKISTELNTARELREEAEAALAECKVKQEQAERESKMILKMAQEQAEAMR